MSEAYQTDCYAWAMEQAKLLRAGRLSSADVANSAEEIESIGRRKGASRRSTTNSGRTERAPGSTFSKMNPDGRAVDLSDGPGANKFAQLSILLSSPSRME